MPFSLRIGLSLLSSFLSLFCCLSRYLDSVEGNATKHLRGRRIQERPDGLKHTGKRMGKSSALIRHLSLKNEDTLL